MDTLLYREHSICREEEERRELLGAAEVCFHDLLFSSPQLPPHRSPSLVFLSFHLHLRFSLSHTDTHTLCALTSVALSLFLSPPRYLPFCVVCGVFSVGVGVGDMGVPIVHTCHF